MLNVTDEVKTEFLRDSSPKELVVDVDYTSDEEVNYSVTHRNFYNKDAGVGGTIRNLPSESFSFGFPILNLVPEDISGYSKNYDSVEDIWTKYKYICIRFRMCFRNIDASSHQVILRVMYGIISDYSGTAKDYVVNMDNYTATSQGTFPLDSEYKEFYIVIPTYLFFSYEDEHYNNGRMSVRLDVIDDNTLTFTEFYYKDVDVRFSNDSSDFPMEYIVPSQQTSINDFLDLYYHRLFFTVTNDNLVSESFTLNESLCSEDNIKFGLCEAAYCQFTVADDYHDFKDNIIKPKIVAKEISDSPIPLGIFKISEVKKHHIWDMVKQEITAYDNLTTLEQNAADWYTQYMFGVDSITKPTANIGFQFARQLFSTYYNYMVCVGLENPDDYIDEPLWYEVFDNHYTTEEGTPFVQWRIDSTVDWPKHLDSYINYESYTVDNPDVTKLYRADVLLLDEFRDNIPWFIFKINQQFPDYAKEFDSLYRYLLTGNILVEETRANGISKKGFCVNSDDYFMLSPDCTSFTVHFAVCVKEKRRDDSSQSTYVQHIVSFASGVRIYQSNANAIPDLSNGHIRLMYYNYGTQEIFNCDSSITGRDVVRSLLEVNGCFFRLSRDSGKPEFVYCTKSGLYPSETLYPSDDLYPREGAGDTISMGKYREFVQEDYTVKKYGKIQIRKNITSNQTKSVVEWEYTGDDSYDNVYVIDDNIFYCNEAMEYDYDSMPEVYEMLMNMWNRISNMDYVPCTLVCKGMPWVECGDRIGVLTKTGGAETFIYHRTLKGIQALIDTFESEGDEYTEAINDYGYKEWEGN